LYRAAVKQQATIACGLLQDSARARLSADAKDRLEAAGLVDLCGGAVSLPTVSFTTQAYTGRFIATRGARLAGHRSNAMTWT
jgi:hypothetical protein